MASVLIPKANPGGKTIAGILPAIGQAFGPIGGAIGSAAGSVIGGNAQSQISKSEQIGEGAKAAEQDAMARRSQQMDDDPMEAIRAANIALETAPKELQDEYREPLQEAMRMARAGKTGAL